MYRERKITVILPALNEEKGIAATIRKIPEFVDEILVVDNGSSDQTVAAAEEAGARVVVEPHRGYGRVLQTGMRDARGDILVTADGDGTYPVEDIAEVLDYMHLHGFDFVNGRRLPLKEEGSMGLTNILGTKLLNAAARILFGLPTRDVLSGMWFFKKEIVPKLDLVSDGWNLSEEIKIEAFCHPEISYSEYHIGHHPRLGETKLLKWRVGLENLRFMFWKRFFSKPGD